MKSFFTTSMPLAVLCLLAQTGLYAQEQTIITSDKMEMQGTVEKNFFYFHNDVKVKGTNLNIKCDELTIVALRKSGEQETIGEIGAIESIVAVGNVEINQAGRSAFAGRVEVDPAAGTVVLKDSPRVVDNNVEVSGYQFILHKGEKRFESIPDPNAPADQPSRSIVKLGALPDMGFDQEEEEVTVDKQLEESEEVESPNVDANPSEETSEPNGE